MSNLLADPIALVQCVGAFWLGYLIYKFLRAHPKLARFNDEHVFMCAALPVAFLLLVIASHWLFTFAILGADWLAMSVIGLQILLFLIGVVKIIHYGFEIFGTKKTN
jgi:hypothetical protein